MRVGVRGGGMGEGECVSGDEWRWGWGWLGGGGVGRRELTSRVEPIGVQRDAGDLVRVRCVWVRFGLMVIWRATGVRIDSISRERRGEVSIVVWGGWRGEAPTSGAASIVDV